MVILFITLERAINGVPGMRYILSDATSAGEATIQVLFDLGVDPLQAMIDVKTRLDTQVSRLPQLVVLEGIWVQRVQPSMLMYINLFSKDKNADQKFLFNYALCQSYSGDSANQWYRTSQNPGISAVRNENLAQSRADACL